MGGGRKQGGRGWQGGNRFWREKVAGMGGGVVMGGGGGGRVATSFGGSRWLV